MKVWLKWGLGTSLFAFVLVIIKTWRATNNYAISKGLAPQYHIGMMLIFASVTAVLCFGPGVLLGWAIDKLEKERREKK